MGQTPTIPVFPTVATGGRVGSARTAVVPPTALGTALTRVGGQNSATASHTTAVATLTADIPADSTAFVVVQQGSNTRALSSVVDSNAVTYTIAVSKAHAVSANTIHMAWVYLPDGLLTGGTITATFASSVSAQRGIFVAYATGHATAVATASAESPDGTAATFTTPATSAAPVDGCLSVAACVWGAVASFSNATGSSPAHTNLAPFTGQSSRIIGVQYAGSISSGATPNGGGTWASAANWTSAILLASSS